MENIQNELVMENSPPSKMNNRITLTKHGNMLESIEIKSLIGAGNFGEISRFEALTSIR
jgi:hypothetical protein